MNKIILASIASFFVSGILTEASAEIYLSHCDDQIKSSISNSNASATISVATAFTAEDYAPYKGFSIHSIELGINDDSKVKSFKLWMRHHLDDTENCLEWDIAPDQLTKGWNLISLDTLIDLSIQTDTLYFGYDYTQSAKSAKVAGGSGSMCSTGLFASVNGNWKNYSTSYAPLALRGLLVGLYPYEVGLTQVQVSPRTQILSAGEEARPITISGQIVNNGSETIERIDVHCKSLDKQDTVTIACSVGASQNGTFSFDIEPPHLNISDCPIEIEILLPEVDSDISNNRDTIYYEVIEKEEMAYPRRGMLLEHFTSCNNGFAPLANYQFSNIVVPACRESLGELPDSLVVITQHKGYGPADAYTVDVNNPYSARAIFGADELQYAPAVSVNHREVMSTSTLCPDTLVTRITQAYSDDPYQFCQIKIYTTAYDQDLRVAVCVDCKTPAWCVDPVLIVCLVRKEVEVYERKDYYDIDYWKEHNVVESYITPAQGYALKNKNGERLTTQERAEIEAGRMPHKLFSDCFNTFVHFDELQVNWHDYAIVAYVCDIESGRQQVDAVQLYPYLEQMICKDKE